MSNYDKEWLESIAEEGRESNYGNDFLFRHGGKIVYLFFLAALCVDGYLALFYFNYGQWLFCIWALFSIILLPKAILGIILLLGHLRKSSVFINIPLIIRQAFSSTMQRYRSEALIFTSGNGVLKGFAREFAWVIISFVPLIAFINQNSK